MPRSIGIDSTQVVLGDLLAFRFCRLRSIGPKSLKTNSALAVEPKLNILPDHQGISALFRRWGFTRPPDSVQFQARYYISSGLIIYAGPYIPSWLDTTRSPPY